MGKREVADDDAYHDEEKPQSNRMFPVEEEDEEGGKEIEVLFNRKRPEVGRIPGFRRRSF